MLPKAKGTLQTLPKTVQEENLEKFSIISGENEKIDTKSYG